MCDEKELSKSQAILLLPLLHTFVKEVKPGYHTFVNLKKELNFKVSQHLGNIAGTDLLQNNIAFGIPYGNEQAVQFDKTEIGQCIRHIHRYGNSIFRSSLSFFRRLFVKKSRLQLKGNGIGGQTCCLLS